jgi:cytosine/uracil/thiamine/allantoin permease
MINIGSVIWFVSLGVVLFGPEQYRRALAIASLAFPVMYLSLSAFVTASRKR